MCAHIMQALALHTLLLLLDGKAPLTPQTEIEHRSFIWPQLASKRQHEASQTAVDMQTHLATSKLNAAARSPRRFESFRHLVGIRDLR